MLALEERPPPGRPVPVRPGRLNHDAPQVCIPGLGNAAAVDPGTAGMLAGHRAAVAHQLPGPAKARDLAEFGHDRGGRHLRDPAQRLQCGDHGPHRGGGRLHRLIKGGLEPREAVGHVFDLMEIVQERRLLRRFGKPDALHPQEMPLAWKAQHRLHARYRTLTARGKSKQQVVTAIGRELLGFIWAIGTTVEAAAGRARPVAA